MTAIAIGVFSDRVLGPTGDLDADAVSAALEAIDFDGAHGSVAAIPWGDGYDRLYAVGLGDELTPELLRQAAGSLGRAAKGEVVSLLGAVDVDEAERAAAEGFALGAYRYTRYKSGDQPEPPVLVDAPVDPLMDAVAWTRDLVNETPTDQSPEEIADRVVALGAELGLEVEVLGMDDLRAGGFALVGKGIVFDTGGLSLKPPKSMDWMKVDMAGAAAVLGAVQAIARLGLAVNVTAITPLTENMPSGNATKPGDVLTIRNGKTIEVLNTDAEGRLILADGLSLAVEDEPDLVVDVATLTGACKVALGSGFAGLFTNDESATDAVRTAAEAAGERVWPMPLPADYRPQIDSDVADMQNTGKTAYGGAITAALLLQEFVDETPWAHLDIAGPAWATEVAGYTHKGGTGYGVRTLVELARSMT
jgi:leucyl aminopeptidase